MNGQWSKLAAYFFGALAVSAALTLGLPRIGGGSWMPDALAAESGSIDTLFWWLIAMALVIFSIVAAVVVYSILHFRAEPGDLSDGAHIHGNAKMEAVWIIVPTIIVCVIGVYSYIVLEQNEVGLFDKAAARDKGAATMAVDVRGFSFGWAFRYRDIEGAVLGGTDGTPTTELVLPVDEVVRFNVMSCSGQEAIGRVRRETRRALDAEGHESELVDIEPGLCEEEWNLTSDEDLEAAVQAQTFIHEAKQARADGEDLTEAQQEALDALPMFTGDEQFIDVNHAFWVPEARLKIDAVAGLKTYVQWQPTKITTPDDRYQVVCAELCGSGHNAMRTDMCVVSDDTWSWWLAMDPEQRADATCVNLRLLACVEDDMDDRDAAMEAIVALVEETPEAGCSEAKELAA